MTSVRYRRYTDIPSLVGMLTTRALTLLEPGTWDDKNDSYFLERYKEKRKLRSVLALCFSRADETYHHWRVFSPGPAGVCIIFREEAIKSAAKGIKGLRLKPVEYLKIEEVRRNKLTTARLPFVKRHPFKPECEVRLLWESATEQKTSLAVPLDASAIERITLSPWLHESLADPLRNLLKTLPGCQKYKIYRSTLVGNDEWQKHGLEARS